MQKKIIALAIASALAAPAMALADATVYGRVDVSIDMFKTGATGSGVGIDNTSANQLNSNASRLGFKGSEDLGDGLSALWQMEGTINMDTGTTTTTVPVGGGDVSFGFDRNTYVGLKSNDIGTLILGRHDTPYKISTRRLDVFADSIADNRDMMGNLGSNGGGLDARLSNVIAYISPSFSGFTVAGASVFGAENTGTQAAPGAAPKKGSALDLAAMYEQGEIYATLAITNIKIGDAGTGDLGADNFASVGGGLVVDDKVASTKLGGGYTTEQFAVNLVFEKPKVTFQAGGDASSTNIYLAGKFNVSSTDAVKLAYTKRGETTVTSVAQKDGATQIALGYDHGMSKNTTLYAIYTKVSNDDPIPAAPVADPSALSFGVRHSF